MIRLGAGIWQNRTGGTIYANVRVGKPPDQKRESHTFAPDESLAFIKAWQRETRAALEEEREEERTSGAPAGVVGTFAEELPKRLVQLEALGRRRLSTERAQLRAWLPHLGPVPRGRIEREREYIQGALTAWLTSPKPPMPRTIRHRFRVLKDMWRGLYGKRAALRVAALMAEIDTPKIPDPVPVAVEAETIRAVAKSLKAGRRTPEGYGADAQKAYARFAVLATTGQRPCQVKRALPIHVSFKRRTWAVQSAKGGAPVLLPLNAEQLAAWRIFAAVDAWGEFDAAAFGRILRRHGWPRRGVPPYRLRHTFAIDHLLAGTDLGDVQGLLGHKLIDTTRKNYAPVLTARLRKAAGRRRLNMT